VSFAYRRELGRLLCVRRVALPFCESGQLTVKIATRMYNHSPKCFISHLTFRTWGDEKLRDAAARYMLPRSHLVAQHNTARRKALVLKRYVIICYCWFNRLERHCRLEDAVVLALVAPGRAPA